MSNEAPQQTLKQPVQPPMQIELQNVKKVYPVTGGEVVALDNISLKIRKGDIFGIIGLSGAGKSTLIRCINRLDTPTEGKILIDGQNVPDMNKQQLRQMRRKVSMISSSSTCSCSRRSRRTSRTRWSASACHARKSTPV